MKEYDLRKILGRLDVDGLEKNQNGWLMAKCPFAEYLHTKGTDRKPSFFVRADSDGPSGFHCFTCKQRGSIRALINQLGYYRDTDYNSLALQAMILEVPEKFNDYESDEASSEELPTPLNKTIYAAMYPSATKFPVATDYLIARGIHIDAVKKLKLRYDPEGQRILFPVFGADQELYGFTGRSIISDDARPKDSPKVKNYSGLKKEHRLLGENLIDNDKPIFVVEGLFALAHMIEIGVCNFCNPVAIMGSALSSPQRDLLISYDRPVYLCLDDDAAGSQGLYGSWDKTNSTYLGNGAVDKLKQHIPTMICLYPDRTSEVDELTFDEVELMVRINHDRA